MHSAHNPDNPRHLSLITLAAGSLSSLDDDKEIWDLRMRSGRYISHLRPVDRMKYKIKLKEMSGEEDWLAGMASSIGVRLQALHPEDGDIVYLDWKHKFISCNVGERKPRIEW
ncbi:hypothetical protein SLEP1_g13420 [Rubroshorea leprosula]|uniref:Uncharacterized protein n=1 Tax=Rubroshorea leprosula TaxID=152421 RepID=A0AAV5IR88_9ROSI|nr:hypothetical protein SLEP1_g13420 [Rubroshorea leprosula]